jgi:hypothetical protein
VCRCCDTIKKIFSSIGATSRTISFVNGDTKGALDWIKKELSEVENIINAQSDYCTMIGSNGMAFILQKAGCGHVKVVGKMTSAWPWLISRLPRRAYLVLPKDFSLNYGGGR